jgi:hypothetical protein
MERFAVTVPLGPNERQTRHITRGVARDMERNIIGRFFGVPLAEIEGQDVNTTAGGGDLNGTSATSILFHQAGTADAQVNVPRLAPNSGNYCGVI